MRTGGRPLLSSRFWALASAQGLSMLGNYLQFIALPLWVLAVTGSALATGLAFALEIVPVVVLAPWAGYLADRYDRRNLLVACELLSALAVVGLISAARHEQVPAVYAMAALIRVFNTVSMPTVRAILPSTVEAPALPRASSYVEILQGMAITLGPVAGSALYSGLGFEAVLYANLASFVVSGLLTAVLVPRCPAGTAPSKIGRATVDALAVAVRNAKLTRVAAAEAAYFLCSGGVMALSILIIEQGLGARLSGLYPSGMGAGWLATSILVNRRYADQAVRLVLVGAAGCAPVAMAIWALLDWNALTCLLCGLAAGAVNVLVAGGAGIVYQTETPPAAVGRLFAVRRALVNSCQAASYVGLPALATALGARPTVLLAGLLTTTIMLGALLAPWRGAGEIEGDAGAADASPAGVPQAPPAVAPMRQDRS